MRDVVLAILSEVSTIRIKDGRCVVKYPRLFFFKNGDDDHHLILLRIRCHPFYRRAGDGFGGAVPFGILSRAEIGGIENLLQTKDLYALLPRCLNIRDVLLQHGFLDFFQAALALRHGERHLDEAGFYFSGHGVLIWFEC